MLRVFSCDSSRDRGVSVSAIRRLYRKRHEEEKARAMEEVRRWWRVGRSEAAPLAEATVAASLMLASVDEDAQNSRHGTIASSGLAKNVTFPIDQLKLSDDAPGAEGVYSSTADGSPSEEEHRRREHTHYRVFENLDYRQVMRDPSYAASVVRDVKQALRGGQSVKIQCRQESSPLKRRNAADSFLMLRTLYMQCVRVRVKGGECRSVCTSVCR